MEPAQVLGVAPDAAADEVRRAFVERVRMLHPDLVGPHPGAADELRAVIAARDALLGRPQRPSAGAAAGAGPVPGPAGPTMGFPPPQGALRSSVLVAIGRAALRFVHTWRTYDRKTSPP